MALEEQHQHVANLSLQNASAKDPAPALDTWPSTQESVQMEIEKDDKDKVYIVEKILKYKWMNSKKYVRIKWLGFPYRESTWEPAETMFALSDQPSKKPSKPERFQRVKEVEKVDKKRWRDGRIEYRVRFKGMRGPRSIKWMPAEEIQCAELIAAYEETLTVSQNVQKIPALNDTKSSKSILIEEPKEITEQTPASLPNEGVTISEPSHLSTRLESALKLELSPIPASNFKAIDQWSPEEVRDFLRSHGFAEEADKFYGEAIDGVALSCINTATVICQCGILLGPALKLLRVIKRMQSGRFE